MKRTILSFILSIGLASTALAADFTVMPTADNDCSDFTCDLQSALRAAEKNNQDDTIHLQAGTYQLPVPAPGTLDYINYHPQASEIFSLNLVGAGKGMTILDASTASPLLSGISGTQITVQGITFQNGAAAHHLGLSVGGLDLTVEVRDCEFINNEDALEVLGSVVHIANNTFLNNTGGNNGALTVNADDLSIEGNVFIGNSNIGDTSGGINLNGIPNVMILNNVFQKNHVGMLIATGGDGTNAIIANNTFDGNQSRMESGGGVAGGLIVRFSPSTSSAEVINNIIVNSVTPSGAKVNDLGLVVDDDNGHTTNLLLKNNDYNGRSTYCGGKCDLTVKESGTINKDPLFVDPANGDFHLQSNSPCINAGIVDATFTLPDIDLDGNPRIFGKAPDMGAYELQSDPTSGSSGGTSGSSGGCSLIR